MRIQIISGEFKGRKLGTGKNFRPTLGRIRQSVCDALMPWVHGARVVDLCAGSGAVGLELLSRGASSVVFVENNQSSLKVLQANINALGVSGRCSIAKDDISLFLQKSRKRSFEIVFYDPPYGSEDLIRLSEKLPQHLEEGGIMVVQHESLITVDSENAAFEHLVHDQKKYGATTVEFYKAPFKSISEI